MTNFGFHEFAIEILRSAPAPLTVKEIWQKGVERGLDKKLGSKGKTPWNTLRAWLYKRSSAFGVRRVGKDPTRFSLPHPKVEADPKTVVKEAPAGDSPKQYTFLDCAHKVLETFANQQPMHYLEITQKALEQGWLRTDGKTPEATLYAQVLTHISKAQEKGQEPRFVKYGKGFIGLTAWEASGFEAQVARNNQTVRRQLLAWMKEMDPATFEKLVLRLLTEMGFVETTITPPSKDGGIDVRGTWEIAGGIRQCYAVQVKRWEKNVQAPVVQNVRGSLRTGELGLIITTSDFSPGAKQEANDETKHSLISLLNGNQLVELLIEHGIGVRRRQIDVLSFNAT